MYVRIINVQTGTHTDVGADVQQKYAETDFFYKKCKDVILQIHRHLDLNSEEVDV